jgi:hypothetical protein
MWQQLTITISGTIASFLYWLQKPRPISLFWMFISFFAVAFVCMGLFVIFTHFIYFITNDKIRGIIRIKELNDTIPQLSSPSDIEDSHLIDKHILISDLLKGQDTIKGRKFKNCHIYGPAVIWCVGKVHFRNPIFEVKDKNNEMVLLDINRIKGTKIFSGAIGLSDCSFINCRFSNIGILGSPKTLDALRGVFSV